MSSKLEVRTCRAADFVNTVLPALVLKKICSRANMPAWVLIDQDDRTRQ
jgi:hypothetical protein